MIAGVPNKESAGPSADLQAPGGQGTHEQVHRQSGPFGALGCLGGGARIANPGPGDSLERTCPGPAAPVRPTSIDLDGALPGHDVRHLVR